MTSMNIVVSLKLTFIHVFPLHTSLQHPTRLVLPSIQTSWFIDDAVPISRLDNETLKRLITPLPILMHNQPARYSLPAHAIRTPFSLPLPALLKIPSWDLLLASTSENQMCRVTHLPFFMRYLVYWLVPALTRGLGFRHNIYSLQRRGR